MKARPELAAVIDRLYRGQSAPSLADGLDPLLDPHVDGYVWTGAETPKAQDAASLLALVRELDAPFASVRRDAGFVAERADMLAIWATVTATTDDGRVGRWMTHDVFKHGHHGLSHVRLQADTYAIRTFAEEIDDAFVYERLAAAWRPETTAADLVGMQQLAGIRLAPGTTEERMANVYAMLAATVSQTSCEETGIERLPDRDAVADMFLGPRLREMYPDFYQAIVDHQPVGNCLVTLQVPSGHAFGRPEHFHAWFNADAWFFEGPLVSYLHFMRDTAWADDLLLSAMPEPA